MSRGPPDADNEDRKGFYQVSEKTSNWLIESKHHSEVKALLIGRSATNDWSVVIGNKMLMMKVEEEMEKERKAMRHSYTERKEIR